MSGRRLAVLAGWSYSVLLVAFLLLPVAIMVPASFGESESLEFPPQHLSLRWYEQVLGDRQWLNSASLSLRIGLGAALVASLAGLMLGVAHMRFGGVGAGLRAFVMLPMVAPHIVLATGGGVVLSEQNRRLLNGHGIVVYLRAAPRDLWLRTRHDRNRPLLQTPDPLSKLQELFEEGDPLYREVADLVIDTGSQTVAALAHRLESRLARLRGSEARLPIDAEYGCKR